MSLLNNLLTKYLNPYCIHLTQYYLTPILYPHSVLDHFIEPFAAIKEYTYKKIYKSNLNIKYAKNFETNIKDFYVYFKEKSHGMIDGREWYLIGKLKNKKYFLFIAHCCPDGFLIAGRMCLYIDNSLTELYKQKMNDFYLKDKIKKLILYEGQ